MATRAKNFFVRDILSQIIKYLCPKRIPKEPFVACSIICFTTPLTRKQFFDKHIDDQISIRAYFQEFGSKQAAYVFHITIARLVISFCLPPNFFTWSL